MEYMSALTRTYVVTVTHTDVGSTIHTVIRVGNAVVASYMPGTRHEDRADEIAEDIIHRALTTVFAVALEEKNVTVVPAEHTDDDYESPLFR